jgi:hypothetical protein
MTIPRVRRRAARASCRGPRRSLKKGDSIKTASASIRPGTTRFEIMPQRPRRHGYRPGRENQNRLICALQNTHPKS